MDYIMSTKEGEVEFNMAKYLNIELARLTSEANRAFVSNNFAKAVECQIARRLTAGFTFSEDEVRDLEKDEMEFDALLLQESAKISFNPDTQQRGQVAFGKLREKYRAYVKKLNLLLDRDGWFGGRKKDISKMKFK